MTMSFLRKQESISFRKAETFAAAENGAACAATLDSCFRRNDKWKEEFSPGWKIKIAAVKNKFSFFAKIKKLRRIFSKQKINRGKKTV